MCAGNCSSCFSDSALQSNGVHGIQRILWPVAYRPRLPPFSTPIHCSTRTADGARISIKSMRVRSAELTHAKQCNSRRPTRRSSVRCKDRGPPIHTRFLPGIGFTCKRRNASWMCFGPTGVRPSSCSPNKPVSLFRFLLWASASPDLFFVISSSALT